MFRQQWYINLAGMVAYCTEFMKDLSRRHPSVFSGNYDVVKAGCEGNIFKWIHELGKVMDEIENK